MVFILAPVCLEGPAQRKLDRSPIPVFEGHFPAKVRFKLVSAHRLARNLLAEDEDCRRLFQPFGRSVDNVLSQATFRVAESRTGRSTCSERSAAAFTTVGGSTTHLCPRRFAELTVSKAAVILIHEALHQAGMTEWPMDPAALRSSEVNQLVRDRCGL